MLLTKQKSVHVRNPANLSTHIGWYQERYHPNSHSALVLSPPSFPPTHLYICAVISRTLDLTSSDAFPTFPTSPTTPTLLLVTITFTPYLAPTLARCSDSRSLLRSLLHYSATALTPEHLSIATPTLTITYSIYSVLMNYYK